MNNRSLTLLGIESSCDECSASVVSYKNDKIKVESVSTFSQIEIHQPYGGVVPEIASRNHLETINPMIEKAVKEAGTTLDELDAIAVTNRPGLVGALLVGVSAAKALAYALKKPLIPIHHLEGHALSIYLDREEEIPYPLLLAIISGGHTNLYYLKRPPKEWAQNTLAASLIGRSRDDAAGEAFDKTAKILGLPYPGGMHIDKMAKNGNSNSFAFPRALPQKSTLDFSFSGLKTAVALKVEELANKNKDKVEENKADLCASIQEAIVDAIISKIFLAAKTHPSKSLAIVGGVAANSRLRERLEKEWPKSGGENSLIFPKHKYCTDNAAMIAGAGVFRFLQGHCISGKELLTLNASANPEF